MSPSRNAPCPCGSGRKYKHCCGAAERRHRARRGRSTSLQRIWQRKSDELRDYTHDHFEPARQLLYEHRLLLRIGEPRDEQAREAFHSQFVEPLLMTLCVADDIMLERAMEHTAAARWLADHPEVSDAAFEAVEVARHAPLSLFRVADVHPRRLRLHCLLADEAFDVANPGLDAASADHIMLAQVGHHDRRSMLVSRHPWLLSPEHDPQVAKLARHLAEHGPFVGEDRYRLIAHQAEVQRLYGRLLRDQVDAAELQERRDDLSHLIICQWTFRVEESARAQFLERLHACDRLEVVSDTERIGIAAPTRAFGAEHFALRSDDDVAGDPSWPTVGSILVGSDFGSAYGVTPTGLEAVRSLVVEIGGDDVKLRHPGRFDSMAPDVPESLLVAQRAWRMYGAPQPLESVAPDFNTGSLDDILEFVDEVLFEYAYEALESENLDRAFEELIAIVRPPEDGPEESAFYLWFADPYLFYQREPSHLPPVVRSEHSLAARWLIDRPEAPADLRELVQSATRAHDTFYRIDGDPADDGVRLHDLLLGDDLVVDTPMPFEEGSEGYVLFARIAEFGGRTIPVAFFPVVLSQDAQELVHTFRDTVLEAEHYEGEPRAIFRALSGLVVAFLGELLAHRVPSDLPELRNTEGHELVWMETTYRFDPGARSRIMKVVRAHEHLDREGPRDPGFRGTVPPGVEATRAEGDRFTWWGPSESKMIGDHVIRGGVTVGRSRLVAQTNSEERHAELLEILGQLTGGDLEHVDTTRQPIDQSKLHEALAERRAEGATAGAPMGDPELPAEAIEELRRRFLAWADEEVPALDGQTPRQAVNTPSGRRRVREHIDEWEARNKRHPMPFADFDALRRELGLDDG